MNGLEQMFPDLAKIPLRPTRKDATLDIILSNYYPHVKETSVNFALENNTGQKSDHRILCINTVLPRPRNFVWEVHEYLKTTPECYKKFIDLLNAETWASVKILAPNNNDMAL